MVKDILTERHLQKQKTLAVLIDPDHFNEEHFKQWEIKLESLPYPYIYFVGGSLMTSDDFDRVVKSIKNINSSEVPVVIFPGSSYQVSANADAVMYLSLVSGRNPEYLIGQQVAAVPAIRKSGLEVIGTSYLLIDAGSTTTVQYITQTQPIPYEKAEIAVQTALAGAYFGHQLTYLDAGSGADKPISEEMIFSVAQAVDLPLIVGGGLRSIAEVQKAFDAGADVAVVGNAIENDSFTVPS